MPKKQDLTGQVFTYWTVLKDSGLKTNDNDTLWECQCECGTIKNVAGYSLRKGRSRSCGCYKKQKLKERAKNIKNQRFDLLIALNPTEKRDSNGSVIWECQCDCGNICYRSLTNLQRSYEKHSCGCLQQEQIKKLNAKDLIGKKFGKLTVLEQTDNRHNGNVVWKCQCDCGNVFYTYTNALTTGNTQSCGCITRSIGETNIKNILNQNNILYKEEWTDPLLKLKRFDFAILKNNIPIRFIEFDGKQHYTDLSGIWNSQESLEEIQIRDKEKNEYALSHNIPLVRIPYWERDNITLEMIMGDQYLIH